jgi:site-specific recombinase XerD
MKGTRPLDNDEIRLVSACFTGTFEARNRGLFMLGVSTGGRISELSELLSLTIGDVYQNRRAVTDLLYDRSIVKGGEVSRAVPVNTDGMRAIDELVSA